MATTLQRHTSALAHAVRACLDAEPDGRLSTSNSDWLGRLADMALEVLPGTSVPPPPPADQVTRPLLWARWPWRRCRAVKEPTGSAPYGRCELVPHGPGIDHALERGMDTPRWSTAWSGW